MTSDLFSGPDVTVVIPTRDRWPLVRRAVSCALRQVDVRVEVVVVDDGSADRTTKHLRAITDPRLKVLRLPTSQGGARARNAGIAEARGRWVAFLDDDDIWSPHKLRLQLAMARAVRAGFAYSRAVCVEAPGTVTRLMALPSPGSLPVRLRRTNVVPAGASNVVVRRSLVRRVGGFDERLDHLTDWDLWIRLAETAPAVACDEVTVGYVQHASNRYKTAAPFVDAELEYLAAKHHSARLAAGAEFDAAHLARGAAFGYLRAGQRVAAASVYLRSAIAHRNPGNAVRAAGALLGEEFRDRVARDTRGIVQPELAWLGGFW
jgi:glycosyltransferase involved in cell wall biosynthesis